MKISDATARLTLLYMLIILLISAFFSANLYRISIQEIDRGFERQAAIINRVPRLRSISSDPEFIQIRQDSYDDAKAEILHHLFVTNLLILALGGILSYIFAKKTLEPIAEAHQAQSVFAADASHELRTPLTVMRSEIETTLMDKRLTVGDAKATLESSLEEVEKMTLLINNLLQLARLDDTAVRMGAVQLNSVLQESVEKLSKKAAEKSITLTVPTVRAKVIGNHDQLVQVVSILIDNAIKYSPSETEVAVSVTENSRTAIIDVIDQGIGIKQKDVTKIFNRFYRADNSRTKSKTEGYGLGLSIARSIIEKHHGEIQIHSTSTKGTTFRVTLPKA